MPTNTRLDNLNINQLTKAQYDAAVSAGTITSSDLSIITDITYKPAPTITTTTGTVVLADNTIFNGSTLSTLTITNWSSPTVDYSCQVNFTSGTTPTTVNSSDIEWIGDNVSETVGFVPRSNCRYTITFYYDGVSTRGCVQGISL